MNEDDAIIAALWERFRGRATDHLAALEAWARGEGSPDAALTAAHKLAGSLGTYGRPEGSRISLDLERRLLGGEHLSTSETQGLLAGLRTALQ